MHINLSDIVPLLILAVKPKVNISIPADVDSRIYELRNGDFIKVEVGREFELICNSSGSLPGRAVWLLMDNATGSKS